MLAFQAGFTKRSFAAIPALKLGLGMAAATGAGAALGASPFASPGSMGEAIAIQRGQDVSWPEWALKSVVTGGVPYWMYRFNKQRQAEKWQRRNNMSASNSPYDPGTYQQKPNPYQMRQQAIQQWKNPQQYAGGQITLPGQA